MKKITAINCLIGLFFILIICCILLNPLPFKSGEIYTTTSHVELKSELVIIHKQLILTSDSFFLLGSWVKNNEPHYYRLYGHVEKNYGPYFTFIVDRFEGSQDFPILMDIPGSRMRFGRQILFAKKSKIHVKFLKSNEHGICFYYYEGSIVSCFGIDN